MPYSKEFDQAMREMVDEQIASRGKPTISAPRWRSWPLWRLFGILIRRPARRLWSWYSYYERRCPCHGDPVIDDNTYCSKAEDWHRFPSYRKVYDWLWDGVPGKARVDLWRYPIYYLLIEYFGCPCCGFSGWADDGVYEGDKFFQQVFSHEGSGPDGSTWEFGGWAYCWRCGEANWFEDGGP